VAQVTVAELILAANRPARKYCSHEPSLQFSGNRQTMGNFSNGSTAPTWEASAHCSHGRTPTAGRRLNAVLRHSCSGYICTIRLRFNGHTTAYHRSLRSQCTAVCRVRSSSTRPAVALQSQRSLADATHARPVYITCLYHVTRSALSVVNSSLYSCRSDGLERSTGQSARPGSQQPGT